jgi:hypothetical protein
MLPMNVCQITQFQEHLQYRVVGTECASLHTTNTYFKSFTNNKSSKIYKRAYITVMNIIKQKFNN